VSRISSSSAPLYLNVYSVMEEKMEVHVEVSEGFQQRPLIITLYFFFLIL
jgi:hypothetical protein